MDEQGGKVYGGRSQRGSTNAPTGQKSYLKGGGAGNNNPKQVQSQTLPSIAGCSCLEMDEPITPEFVRALSPNSVMACRDLGIDLGQLIEKSFDDFQGPASIKQLRYEDYEIHRRRYLETAKQRRLLYVDARNHHKASSVSLRQHEPPRKAHSARTHQEQTSSGYQAAFQAQTARMRRRQAQEMKELACTSAARVALEKRQNTIQERREHEAKQKKEVLSKKNQEKQNNRAAKFMRRLRAEEERKQKQIKRMVEMEANYEESKRKNAEEQKAKAAVRKRQEAKKLEEISRRAEAYEEKRERVVQDRLRDIENKTARGQHIIKKAMHKVSQERHQAAVCVQHKVEQSIEDRARLNETRFHALIKSQDERNEKIHAFNERREAEVKQKKAKARAKMQRWKENQTKIERQRQRELEKRAAAHDIQAGGTVEAQIEAASLAFEKRRLAEERSQTGIDMLRRREAYHLDLLRSKIQRSDAVSRQLHASKRDYSAKLVKHNIKVNQSVQEYKQAFSKIKKAGNLEEIAKYAGIDPVSLGLPAPPKEQSTDS